MIFCSNSFFCRQNLQAKNPQTTWNNNNHNNNHDDDDDQTLETRMEFFSLFFSFSSDISNMPQICSFQIYTSMEKPNSCTKLKSTEY